VQKQHNRDYAVFGPVRDLGFFIDSYIMYESLRCICKIKGRRLIHYNM